MCIIKVLRNYTDYLLLTQQLMEQKVDFETSIIPPAINIVSLYFYIIVQYLLTYKIIPMHLYLIINRIFIKI